MRGNQPARIRQREVAILVKGAKAAGAKQVELFVGDARAIIALGEDPAAQDTQQKNENEWDEVIGEARSHDPAAG
jgi:hypothetical protein